MRYEAENTIEQLRADVSQLQARATEAERRCTELAAADRAELDRLTTPKEVPYKPPVCTLCNGSGETPIIQDHGGVMDGQCVTQYEPCRLCDGKEKH